jgi:hypothetical protein
MRNTRGFVGITVALALVSVLLIAGCATTGSERSAAASVTMAEVEEDIRLLVMELTATNSALASVVNPLQDDLTTAYDVFSGSHSDLENASDRFIERSNKMGVEGREYFAEWRIEDDTYENPKIQALSEQRRSELSALYAEIAASSVGVNGELEQYVSDVKEVDTYFSTDLTPGGVTAMRPIADQTILDGFRLTVKLDDLLKSVEAVRAELSPGETAAAE